VAVGLVMAVGCGSSLGGADGGAGAGGSAGTSGVAGRGGTSGGAGTGGPSCLPDLIVPWAVVQNAAGIPRVTCTQAGASSVELAVNGQTFRQPCSPSTSGGTFFVTLADQGTNVLAAFLVAANATVLSEAHPPAIVVDCDGLTTPTVILPVNL
jgi:hypothetical protein